MNCKCTDCDFVDHYEPDEFGVNYYQAVGSCPCCDSVMVDENGEPTKITVIFKAMP